MTLIRTSFLTALSTIIRILTSFVINKIIAVYIGPSGLAIIGQFQNFSNIVITFSNAGITAGIVKYTAEYHDDLIRKNRFLSTALLVSVVCAFAVAIILMLLSEILSLLLLNTDEYSKIFFIFGVMLIFISLNTFLISILNGNKEIAKYVAVNILTSLIGLALTSILVIKFRVYGALLSLTILQCLVFLVTIFIVIKSNWFRMSDYFKGYDHDSFVKLIKYSLMTLTSIVAVSVSLILVRNYITSHISSDAAGYWQGVSKISEIYLMLVTTSLSVYYLPKLSETKGFKILREEILNGYKIILPIVSITAVCIYALRDNIINILFTDSFLEMSGLFAFQLIGDFLKIASWLLGYIMIAKAMTYSFIITEVLFSVSFVLFSIYFINQFGLKGVTYAYALNYMLYLLTMSWLFRRVIKMR